MSRYAFSAEVVSCIELQTASASYLLPAACIEEVLHNPQIQPPSQGMAATQSTALLGELFWQNERLPLLDLEKLLLSDAPASHGRIKAVVLKANANAAHPVAVAVAFYGDIAQLDVDGAAVQDDIPEVARVAAITMACRYNHRVYLIPSLTAIFNALP